MPTNPLKTTTAEIFRGWQEELAQLQRRWNEIQANAQRERGEGTEEAEGLRLRLQALRDLIAEAVVIGGDPRSWRKEVPTVRLGSLVRIEFDDGVADDLLFVGLAGPMDENALTPRTPLGAAILGRKVGETVSYMVGERQYNVIIRRCLVPDEPGSGKHRTQAAVTVIVGDNEDDEAAKIADAVSAMLSRGTPAPQVAISWRGQYQSEPFEAVLAARDLPYRVEGVEGFYDLPPIRGILALLRLASDPLDREALFPALRLFTRATAESLEHLAGDWRGLETPLPRAMARAKGVARTIQAIGSLAGKVDGMRPVEALAEFGRLLGPLKTGLTREGWLSPWFAAECAAARYNDVRSFLRYADEVAAKSRRATREGILLTPLDLLAGHEFNVLFVVGANEGALPMLRKDQDDLPAERELFYGVLAAAKIAAVSYARAIGGRNAKPSRFVAEIAGTRRKRG